MRVLVIPDLHGPFSQKGALSFCKKVHKQEKCTHTIFVGDIVDHHRIGRHTTEPDAMGAVQEAMATKKMLAKWHNAFPNAHVILGNHDLIPYRQAKEVGLPKMFLKSIQEIYGLDTWTMSKRLVLDDVLYLHTAGSGMYGAINKAKGMSMSVVAGHTHRFPGVIYFSNPLHLYFGLQVGCLADKETYAMRYADNEVTLGCGVVYGPSKAQFFPMDLGRLK